MLLEFAVLVSAIVIGTRLGGVALGVCGGLGVLVLALVFRVPPAEPPVDVMLIILAAVTAAAAMEACGGLEFLVRVGERVIRRNPKAVTFVAPLVVYVLTVASGTGHLIYPLLPVIHEVAREGGVRPERPISVATIAARVGIVASPLAAAMAIAISLFGDSGFGVLAIMAITLPATVCGLLAASFSVFWRGKSLADDPDYQQRLLSGEIEPVAGSTEERPPLPARAKLSAALFICGVTMAVVSASVPALWPAMPVDGGGTRPMETATVIEIVLLATTAMIILICRPPSGAVLDSPIAKTGLIAVLGAFGLAWLGETFVTAHRSTIVAQIGDLARDQPWLLAPVLFAASVIILSQAATINTIMPLGLALGLPTPMLVAMLPAVCGNFVHPAHPINIAAVNFDRSGTTRFGKYVINHSFIRPGIVAIVVSVAVGLVLSTVLG